MDEPLGLGAELLQALRAFQAEVTNVKKNAENPHFKSRYADLGAVLDVVRPLLAKHGLAYSQPTLVAGGNLILRTVIWHCATGQSMQSSYPVQPMKPDPQSLGAALTYARRYALQTLLGVAAEDDDDDGNTASRQDERGKGRDKGRRGRDGRDPADPPPEKGPPVWDGRSIDLGSRVIRGAKKGQRWSEVSDEDWLERVQNHEDAWPWERAHAAARLDQIFVELDAMDEAEERRAIQEEYPPSDEGSHQEPPADEPAPKPSARPSCYMHHPPTRNCTGGIKPHADPKKCASCAWETACAEHSSTIKQGETS